MFGAYFVMLSPSNCSAMHVRVRRHGKVEALQRRSVAEMGTKCGPWRLFWQGSLATAFGRTRANRVLRLLCQRSVNKMQSDLLMRSFASLIGLFIFGKHAASIYTQRV